MKPRITDTLMCDINCSSILNACTWKSGGEKHKASLSAQNILYVKKSELLGAKTIFSKTKFFITNTTTPMIIILATARMIRSEEHTSELQSRENLVCRLLLEK